MNKHTTISFVLVGFSTILKISTIILLCSITQQHADHTHENTDYEHKSTTKAHTYCV